MIGVGVGVGLSLLSIRGGGGEPIPTAPTILAATITPASAEVGATFTANATFTGFPAPTLAYDWKIGGTSTGITTQAYVSDTVTAALTCTVTATNSEGTSAPVTTAAATVDALPASGIGAMAIGSTFQVAA